MVYTRFHEEWIDLPETTTPVTAAALEHIENGIVGASIGANARSFGAVGDGNSDDSSAIQAAIDSVAALGGVVYLPSGVYGIGHRLILPGGVTLAGAGMGATVLRRLPEVEHNLIVNAAYEAAGQVLVPDPTAAPTVLASNSGGSLPIGSYSYRIAATNLGGTGETNPGPAGTVNTTTATSRTNLSWAAVPGATGYRVYGRTAGTWQLLVTLGNVLSWEDNGSLTPRGFFADDNTTRARSLETDYAPVVRDLTLDGNKAEQETVDPLDNLYWNGVTDGRIVNVESINSPRHGFDIHYGTRVHISGCRVDNNDVTGIMLYRGSVDCVIERNNANNNGVSVGSGIVLDHYTLRTSVIGNVCNNNKSDGLSVSEGSVSCVVTGNICDSNAYSGIAIAEGQTARLCHSHTITANTCTRNQRGIFVYGAERLSIFGNACFSNTAQQIRAENGAALLAQQVKVDGTTVSIPYTA